MNFNLEPTEGRAVQRTPLLWAYELKAQRDELLKLLKEIQAGEEFTTTFYSRLDALIEKVEATL